MSCVDHAAHLNFHRLRSWRLQSKPEQNVSMKIEVITLYNSSESE